MVYLEVDENSLTENTFFEIFVRTTKPIQEGHGSIMVGEFYNLQRRRLNAHEATILYYRYRT